MKESESEVWEFELTKPALWNWVFLLPASTYSSKNHAEGRNGGRNARNFGTDKCDFGQKSRKGVRFQFGCFELDISSFIGILKWLHLILMVNKRTLESRDFIQPKYSICQKCNILNFINL